MNIATRHAKQASQPQTLEEIEWIWKTHVEVMGATSDSGANQVDTTPVSASSALRDTKLSKLIQSALVERIINDADLHHIDDQAKVQRINVLRDGVVTALSSTWPHTHDREVKARAIRYGIKNPGSDVHRKLYYGEISPGQLVSMFADDLDPIATNARQRLEGENWRQNIPIPEWQEQEASCSELHTDDRLDGPPEPDNAADDSELGQCSLYEASISAMLPPLTTYTPDTRDSGEHSAGMQWNECHIKKQDTGAQGKDCSWTIDSESNDGKTDNGTSPVTCSQTQVEADAINVGYRNQLSSKSVLTKTGYEGGVGRGDHQIDEAIAKPETLNTNLGSDLDLDLDLDWNVGLAFESKPGLDTNVNFSDVDGVLEQSAMQQPMNQPYGPVTSEINSTTPKVEPDFSLLASELDFSSVISEDAALGTDLPGIFADATASENTKIAQLPDVSNPSNIDGHAQVDPNSSTYATEANETISNHAPLHIQQEPRPSPPPTPTAESQSQPQVEQTVEANYSFPKDPHLDPRLGRQSYTQDQKPSIPAPPPNAQYQTYAQSDTTNLESQTVERKPTALANQIIPPLAAPLPSAAVHTHPQASADPTHSQSSEVQPTFEEGAPGYVKVPSSMTDNLLWNATAGFVKEECSLGTETWAAASACDVHTTENVWGISATTEGVEAKERNCESSSPLEAEYGQRLDMRTKWSSGAMPSSNSSCVGAATEIAIVKLVPMNRTWQISRTLLHPQTNEGRLLQSPVTLCFEHKVRNLGDRLFQRLQTLYNMTPELFEICMLTPSRNAESAFNYLNQLVRSFGQEFFFVTTSNKKTHLIHLNRKSSVLNLILDHLNESELNNLPNLLFTVMYIRNRSNSTSTDSNSSTMVHAPDTPKDEAQSIGADACEAPIDCDDPAALGECTATSRPTPPQASDMWCLTGQTDYSVPLSGAQRTGREYVSTHRGGVVTADMVKRNEVRKSSTMVFDTHKHKRKATAPREPTVDYVLPKGSKGAKRSRGIFNTGKHKLDDEVPVVETTPRIPPQQHTRGPLPRILAHSDACMAPNSEAYCAQQSHTAPDRKTRPCAEESRPAYWQSGTQYCPGGAYVPQNEDAPRDQPQQYTYMNPQAPLVYTPTTQSFPSVPPPPSPPPSPPSPPPLGQQQIQSQPQTQSQSPLQPYMQSQQQQQSTQAQQQAQSLSQPQPQPQLQLYGQLQQQPYQQVQQQTQQDPQSQPETQQWSQPQLYKQQQQQQHQSLQPQSQTWAQQTPRTPSKQHQQPHTQTQQGPPYQPQLSPAISKPCYEVQSPTTEPATPVLLHPTSQDATQQGNSITTKTSSTTTTTTTTREVTLALGGRVVSHSLNGDDDSVESVLNLSSAMQQLLGLCQKETTAPAPMSTQTQILAAAPPPPPPPPPPPSQLTCQTPIHLQVQGQARPHTPQAPPPPINPHQDIQPQPQSQHVPVPPASAVYGQTPYIGAFTYRVLPTSKQTYAYPDMPGQPLPQSVYPTPPLSEGMSHYPNGSYKNETVWSNAYTQVQAQPPPPPPPPPPVSAPVYTECIGHTQGSSGWYEHGYEPFTTNEIGAENAHQQPPPPPPPAPSP